MISKNQSGLMKEERNAVNRAWQSGCSTGSLSLECADRRGSKARELPGEAPAAFLRILC